MATKKQPADVPVPPDPTSDVPDDLISEKDPVEWPSGFTPDPDVVPQAAPADWPEGFEPSETPLETRADDILVKTGTKMKQRFMGTDVQDPLIFTRLGAQVAGAAGGGFLGSRVPTAPGPLGFAINPITGALLGSGIGTTLGVVAPEMTMEAGEALGFLPPDFRERFGLSPAELRVVAEGEILLDVVTGGGFTLARGVGRPVFAMMLGVGKREKEIAGQLANKFDIQLMPVQLGDTIMPRGFVSVFGRFPIIGVPLRKRGQATENALREAVEGAGGRVAPLVDMPEISETIFKDARNYVREVNDFFNARYTELWDLARELDVQVIPKETLAKADDILGRIAVQANVTPTGRPISSGPITSKIEDFINEKILAMREGQVVAKQSFEAMDGLATKLDELFSTLEPKQEKYAMSLLNELRQAIQADAVVNVRGPNSRLIATEMQRLDRDFSFTMSQLFETATAKRFGSVRKRGLRAVELDPATRQEIDELARTLIKLDSPQAMAEIAELVTPETYQKIAARIVDDAVRDSFRGGIDEAGNLLPGGKFNTEAFAKRLGLDKPVSGRRRAVAEMLERSGNNLTIDDLDNLVQAARIIETLEIPNVSTFVARRATIGGVQSAFNAFLPGLALTSTAAGGTIATGSALLGLITFIGGGRLMSNVLSNPGTSKLLKDALQEEARLIFGPGGIKPSFRKGMTAIIRGGIMAMFAEGDITAEKTGELLQIANDAIEALDRQIKETAIDVIDIVSPETAQ